MRPADIGLLVDAGDPRVSPDGAWVAFTLKTVDMEANRYRSRIWMAAADGGSPPRPFTSADGDDSLPRWSPDGRMLALVSKPERRSTEVCVIPVAAGGERVTICTWPDVVLELEWSPDGTNLALVARDPDLSRYGRPEDKREAKDMTPRRVTRLFSRLDAQGFVFDRPARVFVVRADGTAPPRSVSPGPFEASGLAWSPDSGRIAFASGRHPSWDLDHAVDLYVADVAGGTEPVRITDTSAACSHPAWSPDGTRLAYLRLPTPLDSPRHVQVGVLDLETGTTRDLTSSLDRNCAPFPGVQAPQWDGDSLLFGLEDAGRVPLYRMGAREGSDAAPLIEGDRCVTAWHRSQGTTAFIATTPTSLGELHVMSPAGERQLTGFTTALAAQVDLVAPERYLARSADGAEVECWAMPPVGAQPGQRYPVLLNIHGGPFTQYALRFFDEFQLEAGAGFGVIYCNPRGSSGYSERWGRATRWPECEVDPGSGWGGVDYDDVLACAEEAVGRFAWVDGSRLGVMGGSYGGYMASWVASHTDRFAAACSERSCNNLLALEQHSDIATQFRTMVGASHLDNPDAYLRQSPITYAADIRTPMLIVHSEDDLRCPISQAEELFVALRMLGRDVELVRFPGESHELTRSGSPRHRMQRAEIILDWFGHRLAAGTVA